MYTCIYTYMEACIYIYIYIHACAQSKHVVHTNKRGKYECMHLVNLGEVYMGILCNLCNCEIISK